MAARTHSIRTTLVLSAIACIACPAQMLAARATVQASTNDLYEKDLAGRRAADWTHIVWIGPQTYPLPLIWLSHARLKVHDVPETNVVLTTSEYRDIERIPINDYAVRPVRGIVDGTMGAFRITQRIGSRKPRTYYLSAAGGCGYMAAILGLKSVNWTTRRQASFRDYESVCKAVGVPLR